MAPSQAIGKVMSTTNKDNPDQASIQTGQSGIDYSIITKRILTLNGSLKTILFAATGLNCLPVTIPVNTAIELSRNKRCLLVDLDLKRDAVARAFDIVSEPNSKDLRPRSRPTAIKNLSIWPAHNFILLKQMNINALIKAAVKKFDLILISAPYLDSSPDRNQIAAAGECAFIFTRNSTQSDRLTALMKASKCRIIANIQVAEG